MNAEEKKQYLTRIKYHLTMALRLVDNQMDAPCSSCAASSLNQQVKMAYEASGDMLRKSLLTPQNRPRGGS